MALACRTVGVARSWLYYRRRPRPPVAPRRPELVDAIRQIVHARPASYGYRRVHALLRRQGVHCNPKTVHAVLQQQGWLSTDRHRTRRPGRRHDGQVAVEEPNRRWASDITGIRTWDGQKRRLAVILDCADRMVLAWRLAPRITADDLGELVREALFRRFGAARVQARGLEFLSDNGPEYTADRFRTTLADLGLIACHTPIRSPQSNGLAEAFFGRFKRDYVQQDGGETVADLERQVPGWIEDYNQVAPHSALGMLAPAQFYEGWRVKQESVPVQQ